MLRYGVIQSAPLQGWQSECLRNLERSGIAQRAESDFDFLLLFGRREDDLRPPAAAKYGVWYFAHSDLRRFESPVAGFWEIYFNHDVTAAMLLKLTAGNSAGIVLKEAYLPLNRDDVQANAQALLPVLSSFPLSVCRDICGGSAGYFADAPIPSAPQHFGAPSVAQMLTVRIRAVKGHLIRTVGREFFHEDWSIGRLRGTPADYLGREARACVDAVWPHAAGKYLADPWIVEQDAKAHVFCEEFDYAADCGRIVVSEVPWKTPQAAIEEPYHLSYPQVFRYGDDVFCIPESGQARAVRLYRAIDFPYRWEHAHTLIQDFSAIDGTLLRRDGKWWLFCTSSESAQRGYNSHLYIWYASDLFGDWQQHAGNPVKIDVRSSRPAGPFFTHESALYRPAQDCSRTYGGAICLNRIDALSETEFKETVAGVIRPPLGRYSEGIHTICCAAGDCIVDLKRHAFYPRVLNAVFKRARRARDIWAQAVLRPKGLRS